MIKITLTGIILLIVLSNFTYGQDQTAGAWDFIHVTGSTVGTLYLQKIQKIPYWQAGLQMFGIGILWECCDEMYEAGMFGTDLDHIFDKRGFDYRDAWRDLFGILLAYPIRIKSDNWQLTFQIKYVR